MKKNELFMEQIEQIELDNTGYDYNINQLLLTEDRINELLQNMEKGDIELINDIDCYDEIAFTDKSVWMDFVYKIKEKIDKINYLSVSDNYQYDAFNDIVKGNPNTVTIHYNDKLDLGMIRYDFNQIVIFEKKYENEVKRILNDKVEAYVLPHYDNQIVEQLIEEL